VLIKVQNIPPSRPELNRPFTTATMSQSARNTPSQPVLCKMGCGFFGNNATGECCSKCWKDFQARQKKVEADDGTAATAVEAAAVPMETTVAPAEAKAVPMEVEVESPVKAPASTVEAENADAAPKSSPSSSSSPSKKKKKGGYKNLMATMMVGNQTRDENKESLLNNVGGGAFSKVDKI